MKLLLILMVVALVLWLLRGRDKSPPKAADTSRSTPPNASAPHAMVECARCGLHLPQNDALPGPAESAVWFCCAEHRAATH